MSYITDETFTYIINGADRDLNYSSRLLDEYFNILLSIYCNIL